MNNQSDVHRINQSTDQSFLIRQSINRPKNQQIDLPLKKSTNQPINIYHLIQSVKQSINPSLNHSINHYRCILLIESVDWSSVSFSGILRVQPWPVSCLISNNVLHQGMYFQETPPPCRGIDALGEENIKI